MSACFVGMKPSVDFRESRWLGSTQVALGESGDQTIAAVLLICLVRVLLLSKL